MLDKKPEQISESDLQGLLHYGYAERRAMEYKRDLPAPKDADRAEFASDVSSLANTGGGYLIFGIAAKDGVPREIVGASEPSADQTKLWMHSICQDLIKPRIPGVEIGDVRLETGRYCIVVWIPASWQQPHAVSRKGSLRFFARNSTGKYPLDIDEIRALFGLSEAARERIRGFRTDRVLTVARGEEPIRIGDPSKAVLHLVPIRAFTPGLGFDVRELERSGNLHFLGTVSGAFTTWRYNLDGILTYQIRPDGEAFSYVQLFRNGIIEAVDTSIIGIPRQPGLIPSKAFEKRLIKALPDLLKAQELLGIDPPILLMLTLVGMRGYKMALSTRGEASDPIDRDIVAVGEVVLDSFSIAPDRALHPAVDVIWNACGSEKSPNFDSDGNYQS